MNKYIATAVLVFTLMLTGYSQSDILINQYNANMINPAYAGSDGNLNLGAMYSNQWVWECGYIDGDEVCFPLDGTPKSLLINSHLSIAKGFGVGVSNTFESIGPVRENNTNVDISYKISFSDRSELSFGLKGISSSTKTNLTELEVIDYDDYNGNVSKWEPDIGIGSFYHNNRFFIGISALHLANTYYINGEALYFNNQKTRVNAYTGYVFRLSDNIKLKPSLFLQARKGSPISLIVASNVFFDNILEFGMYYAEGSQIGAVINSPEILKIFRIGISPSYNYNYPSNYKNFSCSFFTNFNINAFSKEPKTKRYF